MKSYRAGVIGAGGMGKAHLEALRHVPHTVPVAVCDVDRTRAEQCAAQFEIPGVYTDYEAMLAAERLDLVIVATQVRQHHGPVLAAARHGVHVICEKPMALNLAEADEMVAACRRAGVRLAVNHQGHVAPAIRRAQAMAASGEIGDLVYLRGLNKSGRKAGNEFLEMGTHVADRLLIFGGAAQWCQAYVSWQGRPAGLADIMPSTEMSPRDRDNGPVLGDRAYALFGFERCPAGEMHFFGWDRSDLRHYGVDILGTKGQLSVRTGAWGELYHLDRPASWAADGKDEWRKIELDQGEPVGQIGLSVGILIEDMLQAIEQDREPASSGEFGRDTLEMVLAIYESHRRAARVTLPLADRSHPLERWLTEQG